jgi:hypothetical protein
MSPRAAQGAALEEPIPAANPVSGSNLPHIPRKWVKDAIRVCLDLGYVVSGAEAWRLLKEWRAWREADARRFIADEFRIYVQRRGDLMQVRGKRNHDWRTRT